MTRTMAFLLALLPAMWCVAADAPARKPMGPAAVAAAAGTAAPAAGLAATPVRVLIAPSREAKLSAQMDGRLISLPKSTGAAFRRGDVLAEFDCSSQRAELAVNKARVEKARSALESQKTLHELNAISELDLVQAQTDAQEAAARLEQAEVGVSRCRLLAPYAGKVVRRVANEFETLAPGATILEIVETGPLRLELLVPSRWLVWLKNGTGFSVHVDEIDRAVAAKVTSIGSRVDPVSQTVSVQAVFTENVPGILPGMSGNARFAGAQP